MIARQLSDKLRQAAQKMPVISLTGPRQSGKTTLTRAAFPNHAYVNLENPATRRLALENPVGFLDQFAAGVIIDEAQYAPELFSYIQVRVDERQQNGNYVLTGSQNFLFMEKISQSLAGRVAIFHLLPFSLTELVGTPYAVENPFEYIFRGSFPRVYDQDVPTEIFYPAYIQTYLERDVRQLQNIGDFYAFERFLHLCAGHVGQLMNQSNLANDAGVSHTTIGRWLSVLQTSFITFALPPYFRNFNKRVVKTPKLYFYDTGVACSLLGIRSTAELEQHFARGALFENFVIVETMKQFYHRGLRAPIFFWRDSTGNEVDMLVEVGGQLFPVEIKSSQTLNSAFFKNLQFFNQLSGNAPAQAHLIYAGRENQPHAIAKAHGWADIPDFAK